MCTSINGWKIKEIETVIKCIYTKYNIHDSVFFCNRPPKPKFNPSDMKKM